MKIPEKIYLDPALDALTKALSEKKENDVEYTRTDTFIDKACEWLSQTDFCHYYNKEFIDDFRKAMEEL